MKQSSIKTAILIPSLAVLVAGIIAMAAVVGVLSSNTANDLTSRLIEARVGESTNEFRVLCRDVYGAVTAVTPIIANYADPEFAADVSDPRGEVITILADAMLSNSKINGLWSCWEPNAFDGRDSEYAGADYHDETGRFIPMVYQSGSGYDIGYLVDYTSTIDGDYYQGALKTGKPHMTDPYYYDIGGVDVLLCTISVPILKDGKVIGAVGADLRMDDFITTMNAASILDDGYLLTISPGGLVATHTNRDLLLTRYDDVWMKTFRSEVEGVLSNGGHFSVTAYSDVIDADVRFLGTGVMIGDTGRYWLICGVVPDKTANASSTTLLLAIILIGAALLLVVGATIFLIVRNSLKSLPLLMSAAEGMALGDIDTAQLDSGTAATRNEVSLLSRAFYKMAEGIKKQAQAMSRIAQGDYSITVDIRSDKDVMNQAINKMLDSTNDTLHQISSASTQVSSGSKQIADGAQSLAQGSTEQASAVEQLSSSINSVSVSIQSAAGAARGAAQKADGIRQKAEQGSSQMNNMLSAVNDINAASQSIGKVISVIDSIAFQTNILALNAAVEAARAGQHGRGFAVVAEEVRSLAAKSADAAKETGVLIQNSIEKAELGARIAAETSASLQEIVAGINETSAIVSNIAVSSEEQAVAIKQINTGIDQVAQVVQQNSATAEESAAASEEMSGQSVILQDLISQFTLQDNEPGRLGASSAPAKRKLEMPAPHSAANAPGEGGYGKY